MATSHKTILEVMEALNLRMAEFEKGLQKTSPQSTNDSLAEDFYAFKEFTVQVLRTFQQQLSNLAHDVDVQEMRTRRKILLFHGVKEQDKHEESAVLVSKIILGQLKIKDFSVDSISRCHRMGRASQGKPRPLLVKFCDLAVKDKIWFAKSNLKDTGITISEFLTKPRHDTFMAARQRFGVNKCWTRDGFIHIIDPEGKRHRVSSLSELHKITGPAETAKVTVMPALSKDPVAPKPRRAASAAARK